VSTAFSSLTLNLRLAVSYTIQYYVCETMSLYRSFSERTWPFRALIRRASNR